MQELPAPSPGREAPSLSSDANLCPPYDTKTDPLGVAEAAAGTAAAFAGAGARAGSAARSWTSNGQVLGAPCAIGLIFVLSAMICATRPDKSTAKALRGPKAESSVSFSPWFVRVTISAAAS